MDYNGIEITVENALAGAYNDSDQGCIILGCSKLVWDDYQKAKGLFNRERDYDIIAINDIAHLFKAEHIEHMVSVHHQMLAPMRALRSIRRYGHVHTHSELACEGVDLVWGKQTTGGGTSALFAVKIAIAMGYKKIIVCGCGLDMTGHFYDPENPEDNKNGWFDEACRAPWKTFHKENKEARKRVKFMSGVLKETYGEPDREWLHQEVLSGCS